MIEKLEIGDTISVRWDNWPEPVRGLVCEKFGQRYLNSKWISVFHNKEYATSVTPEYYPVEVFSIRIVLTEKYNNMLQDGSSFSTNSRMRRR